MQTKVGRGSPAMDGGVHTLSRLGAAALWVTLGCSAIGCDSSDDDDHEHDHDATRRSRKASRATCR